MIGGSERGARLGSGPDTSIEGRVFFVSGLILLVFGLFVVRLFQLQIVQGEELEGIAQGVSLTHNRFPDPDHWADVVADLRTSSG